VPGPLFNRMMVNPKAQREQAEHKARPFFLFLINISDFCAPKGYLLRECHAVEWGQQRTAMLSGPAYPENASY